MHKDGGHLRLTSLCINRYPGNTCTRMCIIGCLLNLYALMVYGRVECACMGKGRCVFGRGGVCVTEEGCVHKEGVEFACMGKWRMCVYGRGGVCVRTFDPSSSDPFLSLQNWVWLTRLCIQTLEATTFARQRPLTKLAYRSRITDC